MPEFWPIFWTTVYVFVSVGLIAFIGALSAGAIWLVGRMQEDSDSTDHKGKIFLGLTFVAIWGALLGLAYWLVSTYGINS